ncbi:hypothetical protein ACFPU1_09190 [Thalassorhabdus alkalitolerans]|uniref:Imidazoleglycerol-phosphate dehydratase n=1 Tax=Thalassorhabdus alkalitolerans TaxID=2282697 RepID=A0ABW0YMG6_9BACI|nr:hypothetical protein [Thalassobacillus sp. C254]
MSHKNTKKSGSSFINEAYRSQKSPDEPGSTEPAKERSFQQKKK